ncbi:MAG TPA: hypothetical protein VES73_12545 [Lamprocystis sp. (in: g-proteobacteria)]|nr:hypothetical protein [Lamprocystis sp. (in: g-proteobacteria)]
MVPGPDPSPTADQAPAPLASESQRRGRDERGRQSSRSSRSRRSGHRRTDGTIQDSERELSRYRRKRQLLVARLLAALATLAAVVMTAVWIVANSQIATHNVESGTLASALNRAQGELEQTKKLVAAQEVELASLTKQRIPGVSNLEIEKLYEVNDKYVKKVSFSEVGVEATKRLAYYIVLKNNDELPIIPAATILLFDRKGLQTGMARVSREAATTPTEQEQLQPGETRAYSASIDTIREDQPVYFLVEVR